MAEKMPTVPAEQPENNNQAPAQELEKTLEELRNKANLLDAEGDYEGATELDQQIKALEKEREPYSVPKDAGGELGKPERENAEAGNDAAVRQEAVVQEGAQTETPGRIEKKRRRKTGKGGTRKRGSGKRGATAQTDAAAQEGEPVSAPERTETGQVSRLEAGAAESRAAELFRERFHISPEDLASIEGFNELSEGRKLLILENLSQIALGRIQEEAQAKHKENTSQAKFMGRLWQGITKHYQIAKLKKAGAEEITKGGMEVHGEVLKQLVEGAKKGPEVEVTPEGGLEAQFATLGGIEAAIGRSLDDIERSLIEPQLKGMNQAINEFRKIPYEWSLESATNKQRKEYREKAAKYLRVQDDMLKLVRSKKDDTSAFLFVHEIDSQVRLNQFLNTHPEVEKQLQKIESKSAWSRVWKDTLTERGIYFGAGFAARSLTVSMLGLAGVPIAAGFVGWWAGRKRAKETLKEKEEAGRKGAKETEKRLTASGKEIVREKKDFVDVDSLTQRIENLIARISDPENAPKDVDARHLGRLLEYSRSKLDGGLVNFGEMDKRLQNQYQLVDKIGRGFAFMALYEKRGGYVHGEDKRLGEVLNLRKEKISKKKKEYIKSQGRKGAAIGAGAAIGGWLFRHIGGEAVDWARGAGRGTAPYVIEPGHRGGVPQEAFGRGGNMPRGEVPEGIYERPGLIFGEESGLKGAEVRPGAASAFENIETAQRGDSVWKMAERQLRMRYGARFTSLNEAQRTYMIDAVKDRIGETRLQTGQKVDFSPVFGNTNEAEQIFNRAGALQEFQMENIVRNNRILAEWASQHQGRPLTPETMEEIFKSGKVIPASKPPSYQFEDEVTRSRGEALKELEELRKQKTAEAFQKGQFENQQIKSREQILEEMAKQESGAAKAVQEGVFENRQIKSRGELLEEMRRRTEEAVKADSAAAELVLSANEYANIKALGFEDLEYRAIRNVPVKKLLEMISSREEAWRMWDGPENIKIDLPSAGGYDREEFAKHVELAEFIRGFEPGDDIKGMTVRQFLRMVGPDGTQVF